MARHTVEHTCGHVQEYQLFGPRRQRDGRLAWLEARGSAPIATASRKTSSSGSRRAAEAQQWAGASKTPAVLTGSQKQVRVGRDDSPREASTGMNSFPPGRSGKAPGGLGGASARSRQQS